MKRKFAIIIMLVLIIFSFNGTKKVNAGFQQL